MQITDCLTLDASGLKLSKDGYLIGEARVSRAGNVQEYFGSELGLTGDSAAKPFGVYRDPDVVFDESSMLSLAGRPVTRGHPPEGVSAENWSDLAIGQVGGVIRRDGEHVVAPMAIMDAKAVEEVSSGARALSAGYTVEIVAEDGVSPDGTPYQFRQSGNLRFNHVAYLPDNNPRAGNTRIGDDAKRWGHAAPTTSSKHKETHMSDALITVVLGDKAAQVAVADAPLIEAFKADQAKALTDAETAHAAEIVAKDEEIGKLKADNKKLADAEITPEKMTGLIADRVALETVAKAISDDIKVDGVSDSDLRKAAVAAKLGDEMVADESEATINGMFKAIAKDAAKSDTFADTLKSGLKVVDGNDAWGANVFDAAGVKMKKEA